jgi:hypothetical protein
MLKVLELCAGMGGGGGVVPKIMEVNYEPILRNTHEEG